MTFQRTITIDACALFWYEHACPFNLLRHVLKIILTAKYIYILKKLEPRHLINFCVNKFSESQQVVENL